MRYSLVRILLLSVLPMLFSPAAHALLVEALERSISVEFTPQGQFFGDRSDDIEQPAAGQPFSQTLGAFIAGSGYQASATMSPLGLWGVHGEAFVPGVMELRVRTVERLTNNRSGPINVSVQFIILGGSMVLIGNQTSSIDYRLDMGLEARRAGFDARATFEGSPTFMATLTEEMFFSSDSINPVAHPNGTGVTIPFGVFNVDLGTLAAGESIRYFYDFEATLNLDVFEVASFQIADPATFGSTPLPVPGFTEEQATAVPVPAPFLLLAGGFVGIGLAIRLWRRCCARP